MTMEKVREAGHGSIFCGIKVDPKMIQVQGKVLMPPKIQ